ncbi:disease resistance protein [Pyrus ussuriensis x Pyrus communis]|uniref:Disease resistance protein n=1 Tax=Pyrus ussuriensis x Pyrus communis TaxID=2448454 RepID=A0A5N5GVH4_9ROSA|nr:disease resistance protein [Pyrus ussuriensis x Pyrus communis]
MSLASPGIGALRTPFQTLFDAVKAAHQENKMFRRRLRVIKSTLDSLQPLIVDIEKSSPEEGLQNFALQMEEGANLVHKCSKNRLQRCSKVAVWRTYKYAKKLRQLDKSLRRLFDVLKLQGTRDARETLASLRIIEKVLSRVEESLKMKTNQPEIVTCSPRVPEAPSVTVGLDVPLKELKMKLLKDEKVSMLVLTAAGGCGKTTLAKKFCQDQEVKDTFKNNIFFVNVSKKPSLDLIVHELYQQKGSEPPAFQNEVMVANCLQQFLKESRQNPLLFVLDDVWSGSESLLEKFDQLKFSNYKILVTSRFAFPRFGSPYRLASLSDEDAMVLFHYSASLEDKNSYTYEDLSRKIIKRCKGCPLAIALVGRSLRGQPIEIWHKRVVEWCKGSSILDSDKELLACLQSSLDALDKEKPIIKECFLDLGSFPEDQRIAVAALIDMWAELYGLDEEILTIANLHELTARSLANLVVTRHEREADGYYTEHFVTQHDMLRELAIHQASQGPLEHRERLFINICGDKLPKWLIEQKCEAIKARLLSISTDGAFSAKWPNMQVPEAEVLVLNFQTKNYALPEFMEKMDKLKVLILKNDGLLPAELDNFELLGSLSNLKRIRLEHISIPRISKVLKQLKSLQKISFFMCDIGQGFGQILDALPNLVELNMDYCHDLVQFPDNLCDLVHLKKLSITNCHKLSALPADVGKLVNLEVLRLRSCAELLKLPGSIRNLKVLKFLDISDCFSIKELPEDIGAMCSVEKINVSQCSRLKELPASVMDLEQLNEVICDEETKTLWEPFLPFLTNVHIKVIKEDINLNWLNKLPT